MKYWILSFFFFLASCSITDKYAVNDSRGVAIGFVGDNERVHRYHKTFTTAIIPKLSKEVSLSYKTYPLSYQNKLAIKKQTKLFHQPVKLDSTSVRTQLNIKDRLAFIKQLKKSLKTGDLDYINEHQKESNIITEINVLLTKKQQEIINKSKVLFLKQDSTLRYYIDILSEGKKSKMYFSDIHIINYSTECLCVLNKEDQHVELIDSAKKCVKKNEAIIKTKKIYDF